MNDLIWPEDSLTDNGLHVFSTGIRASDKMKAIKIDRKEPNKKQEVTLNDGEDATAHDVRQRHSCPSVRLWGIIRIRLFEGVRPLKSWRTFCQKVSRVKVALQYSPSYVPTHMSNQPSGMVFKVSNASKLPFESSS